MNVGAQLREAREARGLSVAALAASTRINARVLEGIERNDLSVVPPPPYARGFVSTYAREVGLDPHETVRSFFAQFAAAPSPNHGAPHIPTAALTFDPAPDRARRWMPAAVALFVAASAFVIWMSGRATDREPGAVGTSGTPAAASSESAGATAAAGAAGAAAPVPVATDGAPAARPDPQGGPAAPGQAPAALVVTLDADRPSWIAATADGQRAVYRILPSGARETLRASRELTIRVGNAGAVRWSVNGRQAVAMGRPGEVKTVTLTPRTVDALK
jgi:hypothetical protein